MNQFFFFVSVLFSLQGLVHSVSYRWETVNPSAAVLLRPNPDGFERSSVHLYLCRISPSAGRWVPGKLYISEDNPRCIVAHAGEVDSADFQMLVASPGSTSWVPSNGTIPANVVAAGTHGDDRTSYACRALVEGHLLLGWFGDWEPTNCYMAFARQEVASSDGLEFLVTNGYGTAIENAGIKMSGN